MVLDKNQNYYGLNKNQPQVSQTLVPKKFKLRVIAGKCSLEKFNLPL